MTTRSDARHALLAHFIDDASLFPPASLSLDDALLQHERHRGGPFAWISGPFICPASRLAEIALRPESRHLDISVVVDDDSVDIARFDRLLHIVAIEAKYASLARILTLLDRTRDGPRNVYVEISEGQDDIDVAIASVARLRTTHASVYAKIRCGGVTKDSVPKAEAIANFITLCASHGLAFKATAGLHHPIRHFNASAGFVMHGFLNVALAAFLATCRGLQGDILTDVLNCETASEFSLTQHAFSWRDVSLSTPEIELGRSYFRSYGSCSFDEPVEDLLAMTALPQDTLQGTGTI